MLAALAVLGVASAASAIDAGARAPEIGASDLEGRRVTLASLRGRVVLLDVLGSWCPPCRESMPVYERLYTEHASAGLTVLGISTDREVADVRTFMRRHHLTFPMIHDPGQAITRRYAPPTMPTAYLIDRRGMIRHRHVGFRAREVAQIEREIAALLAERP